MPATITTFTEFTPGTVARSSEVNTNFSNYRGDIVPINTNTASASHLTHNSGTYEHRWAGVYSGLVDLGGLTTTSDIIFKNDMATVGGAEMLIEAQTLSNWKPGEFGFLGNTTTNYTKFKYQSGVAAGTIDFLRGSFTLATFGTNGMLREHVAPLRFTSTSAPIGTMLLLDQTTVTIVAGTTTSTTVCSARITTKGNGMIEFGMYNALVYSDVVASTTTSAAVKFSVGAYRGTTTTAMTLISSFFFSHTRDGGSLLTTTSALPFFIDDGYTSGEVVLEFRLTGGVTSGNLNERGNLRGQFFAREK